MIAYLGTKRESDVVRDDDGNRTCGSMNADGSNQREIGSVIDNGQNAPRWSTDGQSIYTEVGEHGALTLSASAHAAAVPSWSSVAIDGVVVDREERHIAFAYATSTEPASLEILEKGGTPRRAARAEYGIVVGSAPLRRPKRSRSRRAMVSRWKSFSRCPSAARRRRGIR